LNNFGFFGNEICITHLDEPLNLDLLKKNMMNSIQLEKAFNQNQFPSAIQFENLTAILISVKGKIMSLHLDFRGNNKKVTHPKTEMTNSSLIDGKTISDDLDSIKPLVKIPYPIQDFHIQLHFL
jgi:hypothetical protein